MNETANILLIDDSPLALKALRTVLELRPAWKIVGEAGNGRDGIAIFHQTQPSVVVVDFQMPEMNGIEVGREIRKTDSQVLLILFSLHAGRQVEELAKAAGFDAVVSKATPFPVVGVIEALNRRTSDADAVPAPAAGLTAAEAEVVPAAVANSHPTPLMDGKRLFADFLAKAEDLQSKVVGNVGGTVQE